MLINAVHLYVVPEVSFEGFKIFCSYMYVIDKMTEGI